MTVDGFQQDQRVFGVYGPGNPTDILSSLLQDAGYNFLLVGSTEQGTPREIVLTARSGGGATSGPAQPASEDQPDEDDNDNNSNNFPEQPPQPQQPPPIPGASTAPPSSDGQHVKSPAEIIQELQRLRQQQSNPQYDGHCGVLPRRRGTPRGVVCGKSLIPQPRKGNTLRVLPCLHQMWCIPPGRISRDRQASSDVSDGDLAFGSPLRSGAGVDDVSNASFVRW